MYSRIILQKVWGLVGIDIVEEFNNLVQEDSMIKYQEKFEEMRSQLLTENPGLSKRDFC